MLVSWKWLHDYVTVDEDVIEYCNKMIMSGSNLETCKKVGDGIASSFVILPAMEATPFTSVAASPAMIATTSSAI